jgi:outer membrane biogenesis lipoprotein LolB
MKKSLLARCVRVLVMISALVLFAGCDSGEKARDELTGNRAVKQYHQSTKNIEKIVDRQTEKHKGIPDDEKQDSKSE